MPEFDIGAAKREAAAEAEPIGVTFPNGDRYEFPGAMPADFEIVQMEIGRDLRDMADGDPAPPGAEDRVMRAVFGEHYDAILETQPPTDQMWAMQMLLKEWMAPVSNPNGISQRVRAAAMGAKLKPRPSSSGSSSSTSQPLRPTSSVSTESTSLAHSGSNGSAGGDSSRSTRGSPGKR